MKNKLDKLYIFFFGPPGSGKGTQVDLLAEKIKLPVISPGELLRHEEDAHTALGKKVKPLIDKGKMVPDGIVEEMIDNRLRKRDASGGVLFDGFPRSLEQLEFVIKKLHSLSKAGGKVFAFHIKVSDKEVRHRLGGRRVCDCGASYHLSYNPPKKKNICDLCGKKIYVRLDDKPEIIRDRLKLYRHTIKEILSWWKKEDRLIEIDGERSIKDINKEIAAKLTSAKKSKSYNISRI